MIVGYRWCRKNQLDYDVTLIGDILKSICAEKRRYMNREVNRKKREAGIPIHFGRPKKKKNVLGHKSQRYHYNLLELLVQEKKIRDEFRNPRIACTNLNQNGMFCP